MTRPFAPTRLKEVIQMIVRRSLAVVAVAALVALTGTACSSTSTAKPDPNRIIASASADDTNSGVIGIQPTTVSPCLVDASTMTNLTSSARLLTATAESTPTRFQGRQCNYGTNPAIPEAVIQVSTTRPGSHDTYHVLTASQNNIGSHQVALTSTELNDLKFNGVTDAIWYFDDQSKPVDPTALAMDVNGTMIIIVAPVPAHPSIHYRVDVLDIGTIAAASLRSELLHGAVASK